MLSGVASLVRQVADGAASVVGVRSGTEEPHYDVEATVNGVEIRRYGTRISAQTAVTGTVESAREQGFRRVAAYIFGGNHTDSKIAMTAPVAQEPGPSGSWAIRFFLPKSWTRETLPEPDDPAVELVTLPAETFAVLRFTGLPRQSEVERRTEELQRSLHGTGFEPDGSPVAWFYDPPWTVPFLRRNEVAVRVNPRKGTGGQ